MNWIEYRIKRAEEGATELDLSGEALLAFDRSSSDSKDILKELPESILSLKHLKKLDLGYQKIRSLPLGLKRLENLRELSLQYCDQLTDDAILPLPPKLTSLDLSYTGRSFPMQVDFESLPHLEILNLSQSNIQDASDAISKLFRLRKLSVSGRTLSLLSPGTLAKLTNLVSLEIGSEVPNGLLLALPQLKELRVQNFRSEELSYEIGLLKNLRQLHLSGRQSFTFPDAWCRLPLEDLSISLDWEPREEKSEPSPLPRESTEIEKIAEIGSLRRLSLTRIAAPIAEIAGRLTALNEFAFCYAPLRHLPRELCELQNLEALLVIDTGLSEVPQEIWSFSRLKKLNLSCNGISSLPEDVSYLSSIEVIWIYESRITKLPDSFGQLLTLKELSLGKSKLGHWPRQLFELSQLETLVLKESGLLDIPSEIIRLSNLVNLDLGENQISNVPSEIGGLPLLKSLNLVGNEITSPPPEVIAGGTAAIQEYLADLAAVPSSRLFEAKLVIVGEGDVGKTCLAMRIVNPAIDLTKHWNAVKTTKGIDIKEWQTSTEVSSQFKINVWDFGGQEIYHHTHQFFLTKRSLYIFVWDARKEDRVEGFDYWLNVVRLLSENSPILIVLNKADIRIKEIDQKGLSEKFQNIVGFHKVSAMTGAGILTLVDDIKRNISRLPHVGIEWPGQWSQIRSALEREPRNYIDYDEYLEICGEASLPKQKADVLSLTLHHLGVILHFQDDPVLQKIVILKPDWGTNAVYAVLDTKSIQLRNGRFSFLELAGIWGRAYPLSKHAELLQLMIRFELCFQLEGSSEYIVPELLSATRPPFNWSSQDTLRFEYQYDFMPAGIISRFIARNHTLIEENKYWHLGVLLAWENTRALVMSEPLYRRIRIEIAGRDKKALLAIVRRDFAQIHKTLNHPEARQMIPCICEKCAAGEPFLYDYERVRSYFENNINDIVCDRSFQKLSTESLLTGVFSREEIASQIMKNHQAIHIENYYEGGGGAPVPRPVKAVSHEIRSPWASGSFYLLAAVLLLVLIGAGAKLLNWWLVPMVIIGGLVTVTVIGALQLKQDSRLTDSSFLKLMALTFRQLPLLKQAGSSKQTDVSTDKDKGQS
jgi:internalin A